MRLPFVAYGRKCDLSCQAPRRARDRPVEWFEPMGFPDLEFGLASVTSSGTPVASVNLAVVLACLTDSVVTIVE